jgi:RNA polymerase sigma-70 factor, ECF subfamily
LACNSTALYDRFGAQRPQRDVLAMVSPALTSGLTRGLRSASKLERDAAWRALYDEHFDPVYRLACRLGVPLGDVEDVVQRAFVVAHRRIHDVDEVRNVGAWLRAIVLRVVAEHRRWQRVRRLKQWVLRTSAEVERAAASTPERDAAAREAQALAASLLARMSPKLRDVLVLLELEQLELAETAETLGIPLNTVRSRRRLARAQFQRLWAEHAARPVTPERSGR